MRIKFTNKYARCNDGINLTKYKSGDIEEYADDLAKKLIGRGIAVHYPDGDVLSQIEADQLPPKETKPIAPYETKPLPVKETKTPEDTETFYAQTYSLADLEDIKGIGPALADQIRDLGIMNTNELIEAESNIEMRNALLDIDGIGPANLSRFVEEAKEL